MAAVMLMREKKHCSTNNQPKKCLLQFKQLSSLIRQIHMLKQAPLKSLFQNSRNFFETITEPILKQIKKAANIQSVFVA